MQRGIVKEVWDEGSLIILFCTDENGKPFTVPFDHRAFQAFYDAVGNPLGLEICFDGENIHIEDECFT